MRSIKRDVGMDASSQLLEMTEILTGTTCVSSNSGCHITYSASNRTLANKRAKNQHLLQMEIVLADEETDMQVCCLDSCRNALECELTLKY